MALELERCDGERTAAEAGEGGETEGAEKMGDGEASGNVVIKGWKDHL